ncbi:MAG: hypothetical protein Q9179_006664 [Wetmoreana sp. 5 TL-2023]
MAYKFSVLLTSQYLFLPCLSLPQLFTTSAVSPPASLPIPPASSSIPLASTGIPATIGTPAATTAIPATCIEVRVPSDPAGSDILAALSSVSAVANACGGSGQQSSTVGLLSIVYFNVDSMFLNISKNTDISAPIEVGPTFCPNHFQSIVDQCITNGNAWGGWIGVGNVNYSITNFVYPANGLNPLPPAAKPGTDTGTPALGTGGSMPPLVTGTGIGTLPPGTGTGTPQTGTGIGIPPPGTGTGTRFPGTGTGTVPPSGAGTPPPSTSIGSTPSGTGTGTPLTTGTGTSPPGTGTGIPPPGTGTGTPPPATGTGTSPPGTGTGIPPLGTGTGTPSPATGTSTPPPGTGAGTPPPGTGTGTPSPPLPTGATIVIAMINSQIISETFIPTINPQYVSLTTILSTFSTSSLGSTISYEIGPGGVEWQPLTPSGTGNLDLPPPTDLPPNVNSPPRTPTPMPSQPSTTPSSQPTGTSTAGQTNTPPPGTTNPPGTTIHTGTLNYHVIQFRLFERRHCGRNHGEHAYFDK